MKKISFPIAITVIIACSVLTVLLVLQYEIIPGISWDKIPFIRGPVKELTITTDKTEYEQGEMVEITIKNGLDNPIFLDGCNPYIPEKKEEDRWLPLEIMCFIEGPAIKLSSGSKKNFEFQSESDYYTGLFRLRVDYSKDCEEEKPLSQSSCKETHTVYSNEFTIKEKKGVTITTDKTEYEQGESVEITIKNGLDNSIWYISKICPPSCCNLFEWGNNEWKNLGDPMPCIQVVPPLPGKSYFIEPDELQMEIISKQWDMMIGGKFVESGKYRFSFYYGLTKDNYTEKTIYSNEFTIE